ncbi:hypothetical protein FHU38_003417 [Saccharomonospora amisosensis]|uniref:Uncharacterized protein n=1 Tax=Saccharomonospora amisosensis TaxID=1128677 RepID=A0A7X5ZRQ0_9PSEU|nr:hypothetical protein [Saccharomonospora amisosensis]NIJ13073.1 hypothetical protein [Saccharomonospora amisosensis]
MAHPPQPSDWTILRARLGAHSLHAQGKTNTAPARKAFNDRFENEVDPDRVLDPAERARRAEHARKAYFTSLALKSARARSSRRGKAKGGAA